MGSRKGSSALRSTLFLLAIAALIAPPHSVNAQLVYVNSTPSGPGFPQWDGGDTGLVFADIDADGHADFLSIGDHGSPYVGTTQHGVMVYFGDGAGGWSIHMEGNFGYGGIAVGDVNGDGLLDVGYGMHHNYSGDDFGNQLIEVALGDGTGTSWTPWDDGLATNGESWGMFATDFADFDADGDLDVVSNSFGSSNGVHVYRNNGDGSWTQTFARTGGNSQHQVSTGDVNGDGYPDFAASYQNGTVWLGDGEGGFTSADTGLPGSGIAGVSLGDADRDGHADLAFCQNGGVKVYVWRTDHWESSSTGLPPSGNYQIAHLWDMDSDGLVDVTACGDGSMDVWLGDGAGAWAHGGGVNAPPAIDTAAFATRGDIDHNGLADVVFVQEEGSWPNYQNHLYVYRETSHPSARFVVPQFPRGGEAFFLGSAQTIRWSAAQLEGEATVDLQLSPDGPDGPWILLALDLPDSGHWQWLVAGAPTEQAHLRITLLQGWEAVSATIGPFRILPTDLTAAPAGAASSVTPRLLLLDNPARDEARFRLLPGALSKRGEDPDATWTLSLYEPAGRLVRQLEARGEEAVWNLLDEAGRRLPAGVYLARARAPGGESAGPATRVVLLR